MSSPAKDLKQPALDTEITSKEPTKPAAKEAKPAPAAVAPAADGKPVEPKCLKGSLMPYRAEQARVTYCIIADDGHTLDDVVQPEYWKNITHQLEYSYRIEVLFTGEDPRWVDLLVVAKGNTWAKVKILQNVSLAEEAQEALGLRQAEDVDAYRVFHKGGGQRWVVERKSDKHILSSNHQSQKEADGWLDDYKKSIRR